jgi:DNA-binding response OmpR family regulator
MPNKKILIIDEDGFSRVCSAILDKEGLSAETVTSNVYYGSMLDNKRVGLIIISYPYGSSFLEALKKTTIPTIVLSDHINRELIKILEGFEYSYCMIKPIDYHKFRFLIKKVLRGEFSNQKGYNIV